jgi:hypothetical protein
MDKIKQWYEAHTNLTHFLAAAITFLVGAFYQVPQFHDSVMQLYGHFPNWGKQLVVTLVALYGFYRNGQTK